MYSLLSTCVDYLQFYTSSFPASGHGIHSPFAYSFARDILCDKTPYLEYERWHRWYGELRRDQTLLPAATLGAASTTAPGRAFRTVADLASRVAKPPRAGQLLYRLALHNKPAHVLELGTSLGLSTAWFSLANPASRITTIEGNAAIANRASLHFKNWGLSNIDLVNDNFDDCLSSVVDSLPTIDLVFLDGNHQQIPTLRYFEQVLVKKHADTIIIVDDIYWSPGMKAAWQAIKQHPDVRCTIDLFQFGLVFFYAAFREPRHFSIRF